MSGGWILARRAKERARGFQMSTGRIHPGNVRDGDISDPVGRRIWGSGPPLWAMEAAARSEIFPGVGFHGSLSPPELALRAPHLRPGKWRDSDPLLRGGGASMAHHSPQGPIFASDR